MSDKSPIILACKNCEHASTDSWRDAYWWICTHPHFEDTADESEIIGNGAAIEMHPAWCPLVEDNQ